METKLESINRKQNIEEQKFIDYIEQKNLGLSGNSLVIKKYYLTPLECPYDAQILSGNSFCLCENKVRQDKNIEFFSKYGPFLELKKIENMMKEKERIKREKGIDMQMLYFNFANDGLQIFYLNNPWDYKFEWRLLPKDNFEPHIKVWKMVSSLQNAQETIKNK